MTLKELRKQKKLTQVECADYLGIPIRTYQCYETDERKRDSFKYRYMMQKLDQYGYVDEQTGILFGAATIAAQHPPKKPI